MSTAIHEASHLACALYMNRRPSYAWRVLGSSLAGETLGHARIPITTLDGTQIPICLVGYWSTGEPDWPPDFESALDEEREGLGTVLRRLGATKQRYDITVSVIREILEDEHFTRVRNALARALARVPYLDGEAIEDIARAVDFPTPERKEAEACST